MSIEEFINSKIDSSKISRVLLNSKLDMTDRGVRQMIKNESITLKKYLELAEILSFNPCELLQNEQTKRAGMIVLEPKEEYRTIKKDESSVNELLKQNGELIGIIKRLTEK